MSSINFVDINKASTINKFKGEFGPFDDEITVQKYLEKYKNSPLYSGAFTKCRNNGICTKKDEQRQSNAITNAILTSIYSTSLGYLTFVILANLRIVTYKPRFVLYFPLAGLACGASFSFYKYFMLKKELDVKYTPIWLKSTGKL